MGFLDQDFFKYFNLKLLTILWLADAFFVGLWLCLGFLVLFNVMPSIPDMVSIARDWSIPEISNYIKWAVVIVLLVMSSAKSNLLWPAILAIGFVVVLADDALQLHERHTAIVHGIWPSISIGSSLAQVIIFGFLGIFVLMSLGVAWCLANARDRFCVVAVFGLFLLIAFFAVFMDFVHGVIPLGLISDVVLVIIEDGSELFLTSLILSFVYQSIWRELGSRSHREF